MSSDRRDCIVVGAGQAGSWAAVSLREAGFRGSIAVVGEEVHLPYDRPPLSKEVLAGESDPHTVFLLKMESYRDLEIELLLGRRVEAVDPKRREVTLAGGERLGFTSLILACGARVRRLPSVPGDELPGISYLRTLEDCLAIRPGLAPGRRLVVVGAGLIGLEVAACARRLGAEVTVLEAQEAILERVLDIDLGDAVEAFHLERGVTVHKGVKVAGFAGSDRVTAVHCADGREIAADQVVIGIGVEPNEELAELAELSSWDGVIVDAYGETSVRGIYACGDVARFDHPVLHRLMRLECWQHAQNHAIAVARNVVAPRGKRRAYKEIPWWWSDQFDRRIEGAGYHETRENPVKVIGGPDIREQAVDRGRPGDASFLRIYLREDRVCGGAGWGCGRDMRALKKLVAREAYVRYPALLADTSRGLREVRLF